MLPYGVNVFTLNHITPTGSEKGNGEEAWLLYLFIGQILLERALDEHMVVVTWMFSTVDYGEI